MEDEIDLRDYVDVLVRRWKWVVGLTVLAALVAGVVSFMMSPTYEATATLALTTLPSGQTALTTLPSAAAQLAVLRSADVAVQTLQVFGKVAAEENASTLASKVWVASDPQDKSLFRVTAQADTPQKAAAIANAWAKAGIQEMNRKFVANASITKEQQAQLALERLKQADEALANFVQSNGLTWDEVATLEVSLSISSPRIVIQGSSKSFNLSATQIADLSRLLRDRDIAASVYKNFAAQAAQSRIASQASSEGLQLVSVAAEPAAPTQPKPLQNIAIAGVLGLMLGVFGAFALEYFQSPRKAAEGEAR
ncbi:MAG: Wzz/FepE/Etk N-terminal domain-containing protein [Chloroflexota bacterium]